MKHHFTLKKKHAILLLLLLFLELTVDLYFQENNQ